MTLRHYEPTGTGNPPCGAQDGWWIRTPKYVTCTECRRHLPVPVHLLVAAGRSRCGLRFRGTAATTDATRVTCARCIPRPSRATKTVHMRWRAPDPLDPEKAVCNLPWATNLTDDMRAVTCRLCRSRWSPRCRFCKNEKPSREPVCRREECRQRHRKEMNS